MNAKKNARDDALQCIAAELPQTVALAMAYVPFQALGSTYDPEQALASGTLFPDLNKPFLGRKEGTQ